MFLALLPGLMTRAALLLVGGKASELGAKSGLPQHFRIDHILRRQSLRHAKHVLDHQVASGTRRTVGAGQPVRRQNYVVQFEQRAADR